MPHPKKRDRKHTPIVSEKQRGLFGAEYARRKKGQKGRMSGITKTELKGHLEEVGGKKLPKVVKKKKHGSAELGEFLTKRAKMIIVGHRNIG